MLRMAYALVYLVFLSAGCRADAYAVCLCLPPMERHPVSRADQGFITAEEFRKWLRLRYPQEHGWTHERIGEKLNLSAGFVGMLLDGTRRPSKAALKALKMEAVTFYRLKNDPFTGRPWGEANYGAPT